MKSYIKFLFLSLLILNFGFVKAPEGSAQNPEIAQLMSEINTLSQLLPPKKTIAEELKFLVDHELIMRFRIRVEEEREWKTILWKASANTRARKDYWCNVSIISFFIGLTLMAGSVFSHKFLQQNHSKQREKLLKKIKFMFLASLGLSIASIIGFWATVDAKINSMPPGTYKF